MDLLGAQSTVRARFQWARAAWISPTRAPADVLAVSFGLSIDSVGTLADDYGFAETAL